MAYHVYQTEGIVLSSSPEGEASRYCRVFTRELGLVGGTAQSVRREVSKLRYGIQDYSRSRFSIVRGKEKWRIVNAVPVENYFHMFRSDRDKLRAFARIISLLRKLLAGEGRNEPLFDEVVGAFGFLARPLSRQELVSFQLIEALRILGHLGYGVEDERLSRYARGSAWDASDLAAFAPLAKDARAAIRKALSATHL